MSRISTVVSLLRLFRASGGKIETRIRIQKEAYLLALARLADFKATDFYYHHYGPYSRSVSDTLQFAVSSGLIEEERETQDDLSFTKYSYNLTEKGLSFLDQVDPDSETLNKTIQYLSARHWRALELAATVKFLEGSEALENREQAFSRAIGLKPATQDFREEAQAVLQTMEAL